VSDDDDDCTEAPPDDDGVTGVIGDAPVALKSRVGGGGM